MNQPILKYSNEIRSAVLIIHGEKAHSYYFGKDAYEAMIKNSKYAANKKLLWGKDAIEMKPGDCVNIPAGVKHWHGAAPDSWFSHLAIEVPGKDGSSEWLEPVTDGQYGILK